MPTFNIPYEELDINEGQHQYEVNCIGVKAINSTKFLECKLPEKWQKAYAQFRKGTAEIEVMFE